MLSTTTGHLHPGISTSTSGGAATPHKPTNSHNAHYATCSAMQEHKESSLVSHFHRRLLAHLPQFLLFLLREGVENLCKLRLLALLLEEVDEEGLRLIIATAGEAAAVFAEGH